MAEAESFWKRCSSCKNPIPFTTLYWVCSVSTCTRKRTGMVFCSVSCWEMHLPMMRHREAYAVEERAPSRAAWEREQAEESAAPAPSAARPESSAASGVRRRVVSEGSAVTAAATPAAPDRAATDSEIALATEDLPRDILVVVSKLKKYVRARSGMNTSDGAMAILSDHLRAICDQAIRNAAQDGRKTVLDRDIPRPPSR
jgi:hypothetical protein